MNAADPNLSVTTWSIAKVLRFATEDFQSRGIEAARLEAELLLGSVLGLDRVRLIIDAARPLEAPELAQYRELIKRRRKGEPIAYILGQREFYGLSFRVDPRVLIPRPDTETLVETALTRTLQRSMYGRALDLCTGSGCVAVAFAKARPCWRVCGLDLSADALSLAQDNAVRLGVAHNTYFVESDLFSALGEADRYDLITGNPPYIVSSEIDGLQPDIRDFEPRLALEGGCDGLEIIRRIVAGAPAHLQPGGVMALEVGDGQAEAVAALFDAQGFEDIELHKDYGGWQRVVSGTWPSTPSGAGVVRDAQP